LPSIIFQQDIEKTSRKLALILKKSPKEIQRRLKKLNKKDSRPFTFESNLSLNQVAAIYENQIEITHSHSHLFFDELYNHMYHQFKHEYYPL
jgi:DNA-binding Lrp family transcriptional regulator